jgi:hypothetical protein
VSSSIFGKHQESGMTSTHRLDIAVSPILGVAGPFRRAALVISDLLAAVGVVLFIPVAILAIGIPVALCVRFLL